MSKRYRKLFNLHKGKAVRLPESLYDLMVDAAKKKHESTSQCVREACRLWLAAIEQKKEQAARAYRS